MGLDLAQMLTIFAAAFLAAFTGLFMMTAVMNNRAVRDKGIFSANMSGTVFLFDGEQLVDASAAARALLAMSGGRGDAWRQLQAFVTPRFPEFEARIHHLAETGRFALTSNAEVPLTLIAEWRAGLTRLTFVEQGEDAEPRDIDTLAIRAAEEELELLRAVLSGAPTPAWRETAGGAVVWANRAYLVAAATLVPDGAEIGWPLPAVFPFPEDPAQAAQPIRRMRANARPGQTGGWYDCYSYPFGDDRLNVGLPADTAVRAELALNEFIQTLSKTFAHLPIGLAIFDRDRKLQLFNPALTDLTGLPVDFLSARPRLFAMLDAMRERQMIPEPKDYKGWRGQMAALEKAAASGQYEEIWALPAERTFRVTGRPHPDGAVAFLFEDISAEVSLTRRFRAELELGQAVIDTLVPAIAVFSVAGKLVLSNSAYARLWGHDPGVVMTDCTVEDAMGLWLKGCAPGNDWTAVRTFFASAGKRGPVRHELRLTDGRAVDCRLVPLSGGAAMAEFEVAETTAGQPGSAQGNGRPLRRKSA